MAHAPHQKLLLAAAAAGALLLVAAAQSACGSTGAGEHAPTVAEVKRHGNTAAAAAPQSGRAPYEQPAQIATLEDEAVRESSGLAASRRNPGLFWTHNDSGSGPLLYAFDGAGRRRGVWRVRGAAALDWEDMATGPGPQPGGAYLYVGDIGDNGLRRADTVVYRVAEPEITPADADSNTRAPRETAPTEAIRLRYPDGPHNAEALLVHPSTGDLYVVTKEARGPAGVYKLNARSASASSASTLERVGEVLLPGLFGGLITGGDISPDGRRVVLCDYLAAYEFTLPAGAAAGFDGVWTQTPLSVNLGERRQGEAVCYAADGDSIYATSEKRPTPLIEVRREKSKK